MRRALACFLILATLRTPTVASASASVDVAPGTSSTKQGAAPTVNPREFAAGFEAAQSLRDAWNFLGAARKWRDTARLLPETREYLFDRATLHRYMVEDYVEALRSTKDAALLREAIAAIDEYTTQLAGAFPDEAVAKAITEPRAEFQERLRILETSPPSPVTDPSPPTRDEVQPSKQPTASTAAGRRLQVVGGVGIGVGAVMLLSLVPAGYRRENSAERRFETTTGCVYDDPVGECMGIKADRVAGMNMAIAGYVVGSAVLAAGVTMLIVGTSRRRAERGLVPTISRTAIGLSWQGRF